jgi:peptidylprolyl isomerase
METIMTQAKNGDSVTLHYTGKLSDGTIFDSSEGRDPLPCTLGSGQVIPGFEEAIIGMSEGESKTVTIPQDKAYGPYDAQKIINFPIDQVPPDIKPEKGMMLQLQSQEGQPFTVRVTEVAEEHVTLDANPPLAGKDLIFDIQVVSIES